MKNFHRVVLINLLLLVYGFGCIKASEDEISTREECKKLLKQLRKEAYKKYFKEQEERYQELLKLGILGARRLNMDEVLAEAVLATCSQEVDDVISRIKQGVLCGNQKNIILHGMSGTGKSCLAQAIAIKTQSPCLFFNAGDMSTTYMNSGVQNLNAIFKYAEWLEKNLGKPCIIIFDELEALTKKHAGKNNQENNILMSFWQGLDKLSNSRVLVIGTMNRTEDLPVQMTNRTSMIEVPLPELEQRKTILSYYLKAKEDKYSLIYSDLVTAAGLARQTEGFSGRDLENLVYQATEEAILARGLPGASYKIVLSDSFASAINQIEEDPQRKLEREIGTWTHSLKAFFSDPRNYLYVASAVSLIMAYNHLSIQRESIVIQREIMAQVKKIADYQTSIEYMTK